VTTLGGSARLTTTDHGTAARRHDHAPAARPACHARRATRAIHRGRSRASALRLTTKVRAVDRLAPGGRDRGPLDVRDSISRSHQLDHGREGESVRVAVPVGAGRRGELRQEAWLPREQVGKF
jgi:hypothetical protein